LGIWGVSFGSGELTGLGPFLTVFIAFVQWNSLLILADHSDDVNCEDTKNEYNNTRLANQMKTAI